uniref:Myb-like domain-containing protein n=1 Tax=Oryza punctata TaxID=4537 RepID=A0A0E0JKF9_ORYPU
MAKKRESCTPDARGTPWKGRLRSHHVTPPTSPSLRPSSSTKNQKKRGQEAQSFNKQGAPKNAKNTGKCSSHSEDTEEKRQLPAPRRRSPRLAGKPPALVDGVCKESMVRGKQSAIVPFRRSLWLRRNQNSQNAFSMDQNHESSSRRSQRNTVVKLSMRMVSHKDSQKLFCQDYQGIPPRIRVPDLSCKKTQKEELNSNCCDKPARKRKRGTEGRMSLSKRQSHKDPKSLSLKCQESTPTNKPGNTSHKKSENNSSSMSQPKFCDGRLMNAERNNKELNGSERRETQCGLNNWTEEQDMALRKAYFTARPSPNFWKKVSKMVPGKSAEECLSRVHADLSTPTPIAPRPRTSQMKFSPLGHFTLSDPKHPNVLEPSFRRRTAKQKSLAAQKTVRHLLKRQCLTDQTQEADHFSIFETSPTVLPVEFSFEDSPGTPNSSGKKLLVRLETVKSVGINPAEPSPAVLKPIKNVILHEKYVDRLSRREGTTRPHKKAAGCKALDSVKTQQAGGVKAARNALITEATDFISHFKKMQANPLVHVVEDDEDDEIDEIMKNKAGQ